MGFSLSSRTARPRSNSICENVRDGIRILGNGELTVKNLTVIANGFTKAAQEKIEAAGGKVEVI